MTPGLVVKLRPTGPWRTGAGSGSRTQVDLIYHSDALYSAVTSAMSALGMSEGWLAATARSTGSPAVRFSSLFPFHEDIGYVVPPRSLWPPLAVSGKVRWKSARFIPLALVEPLLAGQVLNEEHWMVDGPSECLAPAGRRGPFRPAIRSGAAVDRWSGSAEHHSTACLEFVPGAGLWGAIEFADEQQKQVWERPVRSAIRLLADSGFGGERSLGWGRSEEPEFLEGTLPQMILPGAGESTSEAEATAYWLLSLFTPAASDSVDWRRGNYTLITRGGRVESPARWGDLKKLLNMVTEGSVLVSSGAPYGSAADVGPDGFSHPVFRSGFALAIPLRDGAGVPL